MVLRRHRLVELFLVKVMGMSWTEVHDEAEQLEHAVSDRLIDRIDEMLDGPRSIPTATRSRCRRNSGTAELRDLDDLPAQPTHASQQSQRQDREFLEFIERHDLKPERSSKWPNATPPPTASGEGSARLHHRRPRRLEDPGARRGRRSAAPVAGSAAAAQQQQPPLEPATEPFRISRQLVPGRGSVQPGGGHLSEHLQRGPIRTRLGLDVHPGMADRLTDAPVLGHARLGERGGVLFETSSSTTGIRP